MNGREDIRRRGVELVNSWRADWNRFVRDALGVTLDAEQQEILAAVQECPRVSVASGTARGKDYVAACAALSFLYLTPKWNSAGELVANTKIALTAPTERQVTNIMIPEISRLYNKAASRGVVLPGRLNAYGIRTDNKEWFLTGFKADENNREAWSGFHAVNTMFVVTEASGIAEAIFDAIEGNLQGNSRILLVFNPNTSVGYAARSQKSERWRHFRLNSLTAPNVVQHRNIIAGQVDYEWVKDKLEQWCQRIAKGDMQSEFDDFEFEGQCYRPEDLFRIKVLGLDARVSDYQLIPPQWIEAAQERWREQEGVEPFDSGRRVLGVDVAGMGRDATVYCERKGDWVAPFASFNSGSAEDMRIAGDVLARRRVHDDMYVSIDTIGEGAGVFSRLMETDGTSYILSCKFSEAAREGGRELHDATGQYSFLNMRAYLLWAVRDALDPRNGSRLMLPPDDGLKAEASEVRWFRRSDGRIQIEPKEDIKARLGRSPDKLDALANTYIPLPENEGIDLGLLSRIVH